ncbi:MAG: hypothetical protein AB1847_19090 [bacterium]
MRKWISLLFITAAIMLFAVSSGKAQMLTFPGAFGARAPFFYAPPVPPLYPPLPFAPWPLGMPPLQTALPQPLLAPMAARPVRNAAATITIIFNPALSVVNVSAIPLTGLAVAPTAALVPAPTVAPTSLALLLPALLSVAAATTKPYTQTLTISTTTTAFVPPALAPTAIVPTALLPTTTAVLPGLTGLLPLI